MILDQVFDEPSIYQLREAVAAHATQAGLPPGLVDDLVIVAHEFAFNATLHGAGHGRLRIRADGETVHCEVTDQGKPQAKGTGSGELSNLANAAPSGASPWPIRPGHGLWLAREVADKISSHTGSGDTTVAASFALPSAIPPPSCLAEAQAESGPQTP